MLELEMIDHGLEEMGEGTDDDGNPIWVLRCEFDAFGTLQAGLEEAKVEVTSTALEHVPDSLMELDEAQVEDVMKLLGKLEDDDDVNHVFHNLA